MLQSGSRAIRLIAALQRRKSITVLFLQRKISAPRHFPINWDFLGSQERQYFDKRDARISFDKYRGRII